MRVEFGEESEAQAILLKPVVGFVMEVFVTDAPLLDGELMGYTLVLDKVGDDGATFRLFDNSNGKPFGGPYFYSYDEIERIVVI